MQIYHPNKSQTNAAMIW